MARGRFTSASVARDLRLNSLSLEAHFLFLMTIPHLDRDGLIEANGDILYGTVCPLRRQFLDAMQLLIDEWVNAGLVTRYPIKPGSKQGSDQGDVLWFHGFAKNQIGLRYEREAPSRFPPPPGCHRGPSGLIPPDAELHSTPAPEHADTSAPPSAKAAPPADPALRPNFGHLPQAAGAIHQNAAELQHLSAQCQEQGQAQGQVQDQAQAQDQVKDQAAAAAAARGGAPVFLNREAEKAGRDATSPPPDPALAHLWAIWDANMPGAKTQMIVDGVHALLNQYSPREIEEAITIACMREQRTLAYVQGILERGVFTNRPQPATHDAGQVDGSQDNAGGSYRRGEDRGKNRATEQGDALGGGTRDETGRLRPRDADRQREFDEFKRQFEEHRAKHRAEESLYYNN